MTQYDPDPCSGNEDAAQRAGGVSTREEVEDRQQRIEAAMACYLQLRESGRRIDRGGFLARHSDLADELSEFLGNLDRLDRWAGRDSSPSPRPLPGRRSPRSPKRVGNYEILNTIASGGMGIVYKAREVASGRIVAVKMIRAGRCASAMQVERFEREAHIAARLRHPGIVAIRCIGWHGDQPYFAMDFIEGSTLATVLRRGRPGPHRAAKSIRHLAEIVQHAHENKVLHRDLKPQNILLDKAGRFHVADFGLARLMDSHCDLTQTGDFLGTLPYTSPEQVTGGNELDETTDVYSLGAILYELLSGVKPFTGTSRAEILNRILNVEPVPPRTLNALVPRELDAICLKCLEKDRRRRYPSAQALADDLGRFLRDEPVRARRTSLVLRLCRRYRSISVPALLLACVIPLALLPFRRQPVVPPVTIEPESVVTMTVPGSAADRDRVLRRAPAVAPVVLPPMQLTEAVAHAGAPYGVGTVKLRVPRSDDLQWSADEPVWITASDRRVWCGVVDRAPGEDGSAELTARFLFTGTEPLDMSVTLGETPLLRGWQIPITEDDRQRKQSLDLWWSEYCLAMFGGNGAGGEGTATASYLGSDAEPLRRFFVEMLARQLKLPPPAVGDMARQGSTLEAQFERVVSMLLGFESVRLAMAEPLAGPIAAGEQFANQPLPSPLDIPRAPQPPGPVPPTVERLAMVVPQECFYFHCGSIRNYLWMRDVLMDWGGSLDEIVSLRGVDFDVRQRHETQLAFDPEGNVAEEVDRESEDAALIGTDTCFQTGAGLGLVFQERPGGRLAIVIERERRRMQEKTGAKSGVATIRGRKVPVLSTEDGLVRSFYVVSGAHHLISNSEHIIRRFLDEAEREVGRQGALGELVEYRATQRDLAHTRYRPAFLYVSDPFLRNITSPQFRIERGRREQARLELQMLGLARMVAATLHRPNQSIEELIGHGILPSGFGKRADGSRPRLVEGNARDSVRGALGAFLPICDVEVTGATAAELRDYEEFRAAYMEHWGAIAPVSVAFSCDERPGAYSSRVMLDITMTPYPTGEYAALREHLRPALGDPRQKRVAAMADDLIGLSASLVEREAHVGLQDAAVGFSFEGGRVRRKGKYEHRTFAEQNWYAAVSPSGQDGLGLLGRVVASLMDESVLTLPAAPDRVEAGQAAEAGAMPLPVSLLGIKSKALIWIAHGFDRFAQYLAASLTIDIQNDAGTWTLASLNLDVARSAGSELRFEHGTGPAQITVRMGDVRDALAYEYFRACSYEETRRISASGAALLDRMASHWNMEPQQARHAIERALGGRFVCPLGGQFALLPAAPGRSRWISMDGKARTWAATSIKRENRVPEGYQVRFLEWLRGLSVEFTLTETALHSRVELRIRRPKRDPNVAQGAESLPGDDAETPKDDGRRRRVFSL